MGARDLLDVLWHHLDEDERVPFAPREERTRRAIDIILASGGEIG